jgi:hypothetical protein
MIAHLWLRTKTPSGGTSRLTVAAVAVAGEAVLVAPSNAWGRPREQLVRLVTVPALRRHRRRERIELQSRL